MMRPRSGSAPRSTSSAAASRPRITPSPRSTPAPAALSRRVGCRSPARTCARPRSATPCIWWAGSPDRRRSPSILAWSPAAGGTSGSGSTAHTVAHLPQPLRYAAVAPVGGKVVIAGGITPHGATAEVLVFDPATHTVTHLGTLPAPVSHATAVTLGRFIYVLGGRAATNGAPTKEVFAIDSRTGQRLPGRSPPRAALRFRRRTVRRRHSHRRWAQRLRHRRRRPSVASRPAPRGDGHKPAAAGPGSDPSVLPSNVLVADHMNNRLVEISPQGEAVLELSQAGRPSPPARPSRSPTTPSSPPTGITSLPRKRTTS